MVNGEGVDFLDPGFVEGLKDLLSNLVSGFYVNQASLVIDQVFGNVASYEVFVWNQDFIELFAHLTQQTRRHLSAHVGNGATRLCVDKVMR